LLTFQYTLEIIFSILADYICSLYETYVDLYFTYLEINPLVVTDGKVHMLDMAAKLDSTADFVCKAKWGDFEFPPPFGRDALPEVCSHHTFAYVCCAYKILSLNLIKEAYISELDAKSGASLKLTVLNKNGRIWTMVAGGGASVIYRLEHGLFCIRGWVCTELFSSDTICDMGGASQLANYGEYSGAPSESQTYEYARTILTLMTSSPKHQDGKILIIGGGIANFTNVAATFKVYSIHVYAEWSSCYFERIRVLSKH